MRMKLFLAAGAVGSRRRRRRHGRGRGRRYRLRIPRASCRLRRQAVTSRSASRAAPARRCARCSASRSSRRSRTATATEFLQWTDGVPKVVQAAISSPATTSASTSARRAAARSPRSRARPRCLIGDHGTAADEPDKPDYLFRGQVASVGSASVTLTSAAANRRALRLLHRPVDDQTLHGRRARRSYLLWQGKVPTVISLSDLKAGDRVAIHVRAAGRLDAGARSRRRPRRRSPSTSRGARALDPRAPGRSGRPGGRFTQPLRRRRRLRQSCEHDPAPLSAPRRDARRTEHVLLARPGWIRAAARADRPLLRAAA